MGFIHVPVCGCGTTSWRPFRLKQRFPRTEVFPVERIHIQPHMFEPELNTEEDSSPQKQVLNTCVLLSQRDLGRDQAAACGARRSVPVQPGPEQHQPHSAGRAAPAQVNTHTLTPMLPMLCLFCFSCLPVKQTTVSQHRAARSPAWCATVSDLVGVVPVTLRSAEGVCFTADGGDRWWI